MKKTWHFINTLKKAGAFIYYGNEYNPGVGQLIILIIEKGKRRNRAVDFAVIKLGQSI